MGNGADPRVRPDPDAGETEMLCGWLDWQRATVRLKVKDLDNGLAYARFVPTSPRMTIATLVNHLVEAEHHWFVASFLGDLERAPTAGWDESGTPLPELLDAYDTQCQRSRDIVAVHSLDDIERAAPAWCSTRVAPLDRRCPDRGNGTPPRAPGPLRELADGRTSY